MPKLKELLTGKDLYKKFKYPSSAIKKQRLAAAMAWQILSIYPNRTLPKEWQKYQNLRGVILADEVGGGKTFEALSIISKAYLENINSRKAKFRVLVISSPAIRSKWEWCPGKRSMCSDDGCEFCKHSFKYDLNKYVRQVRLKRKSALFKQFIIPTDIDDYLKRSINRKLEWKYKCKKWNQQGIWLSSINSLPPTEGKKAEARFKKKYRFPQNAFDWIIADEAHVFRSGYATSDENLPALSESAVRKLHAVINANPNAQLLLLTATPFQNNVNELIQLLTLLEWDDDITLSGIASGGLRAFETNIRDMEAKASFITDDAIKLLYEGLHNDITKLIGNSDGNNLKRPKELRKKKQRDGLDDYLRDLIVRNRKKPLIPFPIMTQLSETDKLQYLLLRDLVYESKKKGRTMTSQQLSQLVSSPEAFDRKKKSAYQLIETFFGANRIYEKKKDNLIEEIARIKLNTKKVVTVFCRFIPTLDRLEEDLKSLYKIFRLDGTVKVKDRKKRLEEIEKANKNTKKPIVFLVSQVGNEGLDFDAFCNSVIHFDGHYNPAVIDQRNGRVYRGGNLSPKDIVVKQILLEATYDQRIKFIEQEKRKLKNFYLGDSDLEQIFEKILAENQKVKKEHLKKLVGFTINLEPQKGYLINGLDKEI